MNWRFVHSVWTLNWRPRKTSLGVQTLCMGLVLMTVPAIASSSREDVSPQASDATCTQQTDLTTTVQRQAGDIANIRYLLAEVLRTLDELKASKAKAPNSTQSSPVRPVETEGR